MHPSASHTQGRTVHRTATDRGSSAETNDSLILSYTCTAQFQALRATSLRVWNHYTATKYWGHFTTKARVSRDVRFPEALLQGGELGKRFLDEKVAGSKLLVLAWRHLVQKAQVT